MLSLLFCDIMLSIGKIALGQHRYYEQQVALGEDDYYSGRGEAPGEWAGQGAGALGLSGSVSADQFGALLAGLDPREPELRLRSTRQQPKIAAFDLTFSAPKSVSVLFAAAAPETAQALIACHEEAVRAALSYLEETAVMVRRGEGGTRSERAQGLIAAAYRHRMSRALDPQLHTHVVAANLARGPDARFTALHSTLLYEAAKTAGTLYQAQLRALVSERLGLEWGEVRKGAAELDGVPREVLEHFSQRRREMERAAQDGGIGLGSRASAEQAAIATRDRKRYGLETHTWREEVKARAAELGLGEREIAALLQEGRARIGEGRAQPEAVDERALGDHLASPEGLTSHANTFDERAVLQEFACAAQQGSSVQQVRAQAVRFKRRADVIPIGRGAMTSAELVACEQRLIASAVGRAREGTGSVEESRAERAISAAERPLSAERESAVRAAVGSGDGVTVIQALAGTGKTYTAGVLREVYESAGYEVLGVAPTARAARELEEQAGIPARTLDRLLLEMQALGEELPAGSVLILDDAGMAPTRPSARLLEAAQAARAKVIAIGDPGQLASVRAGGWLRAVGEALGVLSLTEVMRQRDPAERRALGALYEGAPRNYVEWADAAGRIETFARSQSACERAVTCWAEHADAVGPAQAVMVARDNETREELNEKARELRRALGVLGDEEIYGSLSLAVGDRVICRRNDRGHDVDNGMRGTVRHLDQQRVVIDTDSGLVRELPTAYVEEHVEHAYALTGHGMQGGTVEAAIVVASPRDLSAGWSYTALSRARDETRLLIYEDRHQQERSEFSPREATPNPSRAELLARVERQMARRDDEELATQRLPGPGRPHDRALSSARALGRDNGQERAAIRAEPLLPVTASVARLHDLRDQAVELNTQLQALPQRELQRIDDLNARASIITTQREVLADRLAELPEPRRRFGRTHDSHPVQRANLQSAIQSADRELDATLSQRERLARELNDPAETRAERESLEQALRALGREQGQLRDQLAERELDQPGAWVRESFGERPTEQRSSAAWERGVREVARYRLQYELGDSHDALGHRPEDREQLRDWQRARQALERGQRALGREVTLERDIGREIGF
jgi:conjugative relaxase-like TrwC/TraI family protein